MDKNNEMSPLTKKVIGGLNFLAGKITGLNNLIENKCGRVPEVCALLLYAIMHIIVGIYHEPWYDEAVAWQIAGCASLKDIIFKIPHYEGHPPFWYLIQLPFARLGAPYEMTLVLLSFVFTVAAVAIILFKSPFPRIIRLLLPFTYYLFYQYGVIARPYCMMMLAFVLVAMTYKNKDEKPGRHVLSLLFLCLTQAYGILFAGCICIVWVTEIWRERKRYQSNAEFIKNFLKDKRAYWLLTLLVLALALIALIIPAEDAYAVSTASYLSTTERTSTLVQLVYLLFALPTEATCSAVYNKFGSLGGAVLSLSQVLVPAIVGIMIFMLIGLYAKKKGRLLLLFLPQLLFAIFCLEVYFYPHHIGIIVLFLLFWFWVACESEADNRLPISERDKKTVVSGAVLLGTILMLVSLFWSVVSIVNEIKYVYGAGRNEAGFIAHYGLDNYKIMAEWEVRDDSDGNIIYMDTNFCAYADNVGPYLGRNIFYNFNDGSDDVNYTTHEKSSDEEMEEILEKWREEGYPDILYQTPRLDAIWDESELSYDDYALVYIEPVNYIYKYELQTGDSKIYVRRDLLDELGLVEIDEPMFLTLETMSKIENPNLDYLK